MEPSEPANRALQSTIESLLLVAGGAVSLRDLCHATGESPEAVANALSELQRALTGGIRLQLSGAEAQLVSAPENAEVVHRYLGTARPSPLSRAALETLTVIAYRQPVTRGEIEATRGANSDRAVQTLLARELIEERGARMTVGRPMQYGTAFGFLEYFGLGSLEELPPLEGDAAIGVRQLGLREADEKSAGQ